METVFNKYIANRFLIDHVYIFIGYGGYWLFQDYNFCKLDILKCIQFDTVWIYAEIGIKIYTKYILIIPKLFLYFSIPFNYNKSIKKKGGFENGCLWLSSDKYNRAAFR